MKFPSARAAWLQCLGLTLSIAPAVATAEIIVLKNGDQITGTISKIWDNEVMIEPAYSDEFAVDQDAIDYIEGEDQYEIKWQGRSDVVAKFAGKDDNGNQLVEIDGEQYSVSLMEIKDLEEIEEFFDWSANADLNTTFNSGNTNNFSTSLSADIMLKYGRQRHIVDLLWQKEEQRNLDTGEDVTVKDREFFRYNLNYDVSDPWFAGAVASYESDPFKNLDYRYNLMPTIGFNFWDEPSRLFNIQFGVGYQAEEIFQDNIAPPPDVLVTEQNGIIAQAIIRFRYDFAEPDLSFFLNNTTTAAFYGRENQVTQFRTGFNYEITDLLYFNLEWLLDYESQPVEGVESEDISLLIGFGLEFDK